MPSDPERHLGESSLPTPKMRFDECRGCGLKKTLYDNGLCATCQSNPVHNPPQPEEKTDE